MEVLKLYFPLVKKLKKKGQGKTNGGALCEGLSNFGTKFQSILVQNGPDLLTIKTSICRTHS